MKILHTSDWHIGKKLGRFDRTDEYREVLNEVAEIANREKADLVVNSGDVFDRPIPRMEDLSLGLEALIRLTNQGRRPVVAIAGNHDSPDLFEVLAPLLSPRNVHLVGDVKKPKEGGILDLKTPGGRAVVACFPFLREGRVVNLWDPVGKRRKEFADRVKEISDTYAEDAREAAGAEAVTILVAHFLVDGAKVQLGAPRGERPLHMTQAFAANPQAIPPGPQYVAMGHIHNPQSITGAPAAEYAGSLLEMDFGETGEQKRVVIVDVKPGQPAKVNSVNLQGGRRLLRPSGTWNEIKEKPGIYDSYLDLTVHTDGPDPGLADRARDEFEYLVKVRAEYPRTEQERPDRAGRPLVELYGDYYQQQNGVEVPEGLADAFRELEEEVANAAH